MAGCARLPAAREAADAPEDRVRIGDEVRLETADGSVEGTLVDRLSDGYLVRVGDQTRTVPYAQVRSVARVGDWAEAPTQDDRHAFTAFATFQWMLPQEPNVHHMALAQDDVDAGSTAFDREPDDQTTFAFTTTGTLTEWFSLGLDLTLNQTSAKQIEAGTHGCEYLDECEDFTEDVWHNTSTFQFTLWSKLHYRLAAFRPWVGLGAHIASVSYGYDVSPDGESGFGSGDDTAFSVGFGMGADYRIPIAGFGAYLSGQLAIGSPTFDEDIARFVSRGDHYERANVGHAVPAWRLGLGVGVGL